MRYFKHKRGRFLFSQIKPWASQNLNARKCFYANEIANWVKNISNHTLMNQYSHNCSAGIASALCIKAAKKMLNSDLSCSNSSYNGVSIGIPICYKCWKNTFLSEIVFLKWAATWQNQQNECGPSEDSDQPGSVWSESSLSAWRKLGS